MKKHITVEVCCGSVDDCLLAQKLGADRIELNHALELGGMTPSMGTFLEVKRQVSLPICVMIRPRGAGFDYTEAQFQVMLKDAELFIEHGADGLVFGFLLMEAFMKNEPGKWFKQPMARKLFFTKPMTVQRIWKRH